MNLVDTGREILLGGWLTGPIFDKELRVASRRRRSYWIRFAYLCLLGIILALLWSAIVGRGGVVYSMSRMAEAGQAMCAYLVWFQFIACQVLAVVFLSTSIGDEIDHRTLGVLMTTPINAFQIVAGKLFSGLLQLILLVALSLPILALIRVFGGISWDYLLAGIVMTLTSMILVGAISLLVSVYCRRAYVVIIVTFLIIGGIWALIPLLGAIPGAVFDMYSERPWLVFFSYCNPYFSLITATETLMSPGRVAWSAPWFWQCDALLMLVASGIILGFTTLRVRTVALRQACGEMRPVKRLVDKGPVRSVTGPLRIMTGCPVLWKEMRGPLLGRHPILARMGIGLLLLTLIVIYVALAIENHISDEWVHVAFSVCLMGLASVFSAVVPATVITSEKESRSWPILLVTSLADRQILNAKWLGAIRRTLFAWVFLFGHVVLFTLLGCIHPWAGIQVFMVVASVVILLSGSGLYFSARCRRTTVAVVFNIGFALTLWIFIPFLMVMFDEITRSGDDLLEVVMDFNPFIQMGVVMDACANGWGSVQNYDWNAFRNIKGVSDTTVFLFFSLLLHLLVGKAMALRAKRLFRRRIF